MSQMPRHEETDHGAPAAFYAARGGRVADWWTLLHPPYTAWHLSYVVIGAGLAPRLDLFRLGLTLLAFLLAVGVSAHALDELQGRPLRTGISDGALWTAAMLGLLGAVGLGIYGVTVVGWGLVAFIVLGTVLVPAYNLEWFGGRIHTDAGFAVTWGAFPALTAFYAQAERLNGVALLAAAAAFCLTLTQRSLSTPARRLRRRVRRVEVRLEMADGTREQVGSEFLLGPLERALRATSWAITLLAGALVVARV